jgi:hypothetical protein
MRCPHCQSEVPPGTDRCPACERPIPPAAAAPEGPAEPPTAPTEPGELERWLGQLRQWHEAADALGVEVPAVPRWVEARARGEPSEGWNEVVRRLEEVAATTIAAALARWEGTMQERLEHLEAYGVDVQLERAEVRETLDAVRNGEAARMVASCRQVDRLVSLKERHLDQARDEVQRLVGMLEDMRSLGMVPPRDPSKVATDLEAELRRGRLAPLKERMRSLRAEATGHLAQQLPAYVTWYGTFLAGERANGGSVDREAAELARGARAFHRGHAEEALHRLRVLAESHPAPGRPGPSEPAG